MAAMEDATGRILIVESNTTKKANEVGAYTSAGAVDVSFGAQGRAAAAIGEYTRATAIVAAPDGRIVIMAPYYPNGDLVLARFFP
jgi:hypothetical protein